MIEIFRRPGDGAVTAAPARPVEETRSREHSWARFYPAALVLAISLGAAVRLYPILRSDFPLNDGGMFYAMVQDIQHHNFALPTVTNYNSDGIPFAYPPLALYIAAFLDRLTPIGLSTWFRILPFVFTAGTVVGVWRLAGGMLRSRPAVVVAIAAYALIPRSYIWLLMGGGLTRSLGMMLAIFALDQVYRMYTTRRWIYLPGAILLGAGTVLSHPETAAFLAFSIGVFWLFRGLHRPGIVQSICLLAGTVAMTAPWWLTVIARHGIEPFRDANATGGTFFSDPLTREAPFIILSRMVATSEPYFPVIGAIALVGGFACFASRRLAILPAWWLAVVLFDRRAFATYDAVPIALIVGVVIGEMLLPLLRREEGPDFAAPALSWQGLAENPPFGLRWSALAAIACGLLYLTAGALTRKPGVAEASSLVALKPDERGAMAWVAAQTPPDARFFVVPHGAWETDKQTEWFPALTGRQSVTTVQGNEWLPDGAFTTAVERHDAAGSCGDQSGECLTQWSMYFGTSFDYVFVPGGDARGCCGLMTASFTRDPRFVPLYMSSGGSVYKFEPANAKTLTPIIPTEPIQGVPPKP